MSELEDAKRLYDRGRNLYEKSDFEAAARILKQAAQKTERQIFDRISLKLSHEVQDITLEIWDWCSMAMHNAGDYEQAVSCNARNLHIRLRSPDYGPEHEDTLVTRRRLVQNYEELWQHDDAIAESRKLITATHDISDYSILAQQLFKKGDSRSIKEAVEVNMNILRKEESILGKNNFTICAARYNLGVELHELKKFEDSKIFLEENAKILKATISYDDVPEQDRQNMCELLHDTEIALTRSIEEIELRNMRKEQEVEAKKETRRLKEEQEQEALSLENELVKERELEKERLEYERNTQQDLCLELQDRKRIQNLMEDLDDEETSVRSEDGFPRAPNRYRESRANLSSLKIPRKIHEDIVIPKEQYKNYRRHSSNPSYFRNRLDCSKSAESLPRFSKTSEFNRLSLDGERSLTETRRKSTGNTAEIPKPTKVELQSSPRDSSPRYPKSTPLVSTRDLVDVPQITVTGDDSNKTVRKRHSYEIKASVYSDSLMPAGRLERSSSVGHSKRPERTDGYLYDDPMNSEGTNADLWFETLKDTAHKFLDNYADSRLQGAREHYERVKIAVLDSGVANSFKCPAPKSIRISKNRITWCSIECSKLDPKDDEVRHGTKVASIILKVTPYAKLYIYRILRDDEDEIQPAVVAAALEDAVMKHNVDIVNMSFGWQHETGNGHDELRTALRKCFEKDVLIFAATSNDHIRSESGMAYPARADGVIAIDAATSKGDWLDINPSRDNEFKTHRFTALGRDIGTDKDWPRMTGTSAATPIAAGIAALILEFARQPPLSFAPDIAKILKRPDAMREVLAGACSVKRTKNGEYRHFVPEKLFRCHPGADDAGEWFNLNSRRREVAESIGAILKTKHGGRILEPMNVQIQHWWKQTSRG